MGFVPNRDFRVEKNFFYDFFPTRLDFTKWMKRNVLDDTPITQDGQLTYRDIGDDFIAIFYYSFEREYRNKIVYEQEYFYQDFAREFFEKRLKFGILYQLWRQQNDNDPFDMMNDNYYEIYKHNRNEDSKDQDQATSNAITSQRGNENTLSSNEAMGNEKSDNTGTASDQIKDKRHLDATVTATLEETITLDSAVNTTDQLDTTNNITETTNATNLSKSNDGSIQGQLQLSDMDLGNVGGGEDNDGGIDSATSATVGKNSSNDTTDSTGNSTRATDTTTKTKNDRNSTNTTSNLTDETNDRMGFRETNDVANRVSNSSVKGSNNREMVNEQNNAGQSERSHAYNSKISSDDERRRNKLNKVDLINSFTNLDLESGFRKFVRTFNRLFSRLNAGYFYWNGYLETNYDDIPLEDINEDPLPISEVVKNTDLGFIPRNRVNSDNITKIVLLNNSGLTADDFFVSNIFLDRGIANIIGDGNYQGWMSLTFETQANFK